MYGRKYDFEGYIDNIHVNTMCQYYIFLKQFKFHFLVVTDRAGVDEPGMPVLRPSQENDI